MLLFKLSGVSGLVVRCIGLVNENSWFKFYCC